MIKLLIGGSPCTHWSIAQKNNRETTAEGIGWELFRNYLIAKEKFQPDFFLYENNKSAAEPIKEQIRQELGVTQPSLFQNDNGVRFTLINSALVSAQNRQRFYVTNFGDIEQPADRGILLKDILETGISDHEKAYCLKHQAGNSRDYFKKHHTQVAFEQVPVNDTSGKTRALKAQYYKNGLANFITNDGYSATCIAERGRLENGEYQQQFEPREDGKTNSLTTVQKDNNVCEPVRIGDIGSTAQAHRVYSADGKSVTVNSGGGGQGGKTGLYAMPVGDVKQKPFHGVKNGLITIKDKQYPIKLQDGFYIIRKLTPIECERLQTLPDDFTLYGAIDWAEDIAKQHKKSIEKGMARLDLTRNQLILKIANTNRYKGLGNGWTAEVIIHLLQHAKIPLNEEIVVCSMYDGIGTGRYCLDKMGYTNVKYYAYEIDKYAIQIAKSNYPDIIEMGDAFAVRNADWMLSAGVRGRRYQHYGRVTRQNSNLIK